MTDTLLVRHCAPILAGLKTGADDYITKPFSLPVLYAKLTALVNRSRGEYAYTMLDLDHPTPPGVIEKLRNMDGVLRVRVIR